MKRILLFSLAIILSCNLFAQGIDYGEASRSYISAGVVGSTKGVMVPRYSDTAAANAVTPHPINLTPGMVIMTLTPNAVWFRDLTATVWIRIGSGSNSNISVSDTLTAYVSIGGDDATAIVGDPSKPFLTIDAALLATSPQAVVIHIGVGTFHSPHNANMRSNMYLYGSGQPDVDNHTVLTDIYGSVSNSAPTKLVGGTILDSTFYLPWNASFVTIKDLGIDCGSAYVNAFAGGTASDALLVCQYFNLAGGQSSADGYHRLQDTLRLGINVENVTTLCKDATSSVHSALFENCYENHVTNLKTYFGFAGLVSKTISGVYTNISTNGHGTYGIVFKDNDYSHCRNNSLTNFSCNSIGYYDGEGLDFSSGTDAGSGAAQFITVANGTIDHVKHGIRTDGNPAQAVTTAVYATNVSIFGSQSQAVICNLVYSKFDNVNGWGSGSTGFDITNAYGGNVSLTNCGALASLGDGFHLTSSPSYSSITFNNLTSTDNGGYPLVTTGYVSGIGLLARNNSSGNDIQGSLTPLGVNTSIPTATFDVNGDGTNESFRVRNTLTATDTTNYKPVCMDVDGNERELPYWPAASGSGSDMTVSAGNGLIKSTVADTVTLSVDTTAITLLTKTEADSLLLRGLINTNTTAISGKQNTLTLTTTGTSGAATLTGSTLNVPNYATGTGTVTAVSVTTANGVSGTVATSTTTPAITLTLGAITPTTVNGCTISTATNDTVAVASGKKLTVSNTLTLAGTDGSTLNIGAGCTLKSAAQTDSGTNVRVGLASATGNVLTQGNINSMAFANGAMGYAPAIGGTTKFGLSWSSGGDVKVGGLDASGGFAELMANGVECGRGFASGNFGFGNTSDTGSAKMTVTSTTKGFLMPRMTNTQMLAISLPATGLQVFNITSGKIFVYKGSNWAALVDSSSIITPTLFTQTTSNVVTGTTSETVARGAGIGTDSIPANYIVAGKVIQLTLAGVETMPAITAGTILVNVYYGSTVIATGTTSATGLAGLTNASFNATVRFTCQTGGATGTAVIDGSFNYSTGNNLPKNSLDLNNGGAQLTGIDFTTKKRFYVTYTLSTATTESFNTNTYILQALN